MQNFDINNILLKTICPNNEFIPDQFGNPSVMVYIPKFTMNQVINGGSNKVHPAFIVNGVERDGFYISKYQNTDVDGTGYSLPGVIPCHSAGFESSLEKCAAKGRGWHLMTMQEWGAIALLCKKNGHLPYGNNDHGRDRRENMFKAIPITNAENLAGGVLTGTGPLSWSHDNTTAGIWDLNGNLSEWVGGFRTVYGEIQVLPDNNGADIHNSHDADSRGWRAINAATGEYIIPDGSGTTKGSVKLDFVDSGSYGWHSKWHIATQIKNRSDDTRRCDLSLIECTEEIGPDAKELLISFGIIPDDPMYDYREQHAYHNNSKAECFTYRGGWWGSGTTAGVFKWSCSWGREHTHVGHSYRAAYIPL